MKYYYEILKDVYVEYKTYTVKMPFKIGEIITAKTMDNPSFMVVEKTHTFNNIEIYKWIINGWVKEVKSPVNYSDEYFLFDKLKNKLHDEIINSKTILSRIGEMKYTSSSSKMTYFSNKGEYGMYEILRDLFIVLDKPIHFRK